MVCICPFLSLVPGRRDYVIGEASIAAIPFRSVLKHVPPGSGHNLQKEPEDMIAPEGNISNRGKGLLEKLNPNAAGIDIGSKEHYVAVPPDPGERAVRKFGCFTEDLHRMARWLGECGVQKVAMESTGVYWIPVFEVLEGHGFEVSLVDARQVKNVPGRKTDVLDCQWLQELHTFGLLRGCFRPAGEVAVVRAYWRQRRQLVQSASRQILLMQKALEQMNVQLHKVVSDISGVTGMSIIREIVAGERDPKKLAENRAHGVKASQHTIAAALEGNWREEHVFALKQAVELYDVFQGKIAECDEKVRECLRGCEQKGDPGDLADGGKAGRGRRKNQPYFDLRAELYRMTGVDLTAIDGIDAMTAMTILAECGSDLSMFASEKEYASWLCLAPNNRITGGKIKSRKTRKSANRSADALRLAAQSLHSSQSALGAFYRRMRARLGPAKAVTATAHKLACLIYRMLRYGMEYVDQGQDYYNEQYRQRVVKNLSRQATRLGFLLVSVGTGEVS